MEWCEEGNEAEGKNVTKITERVDKGIERKKKMDKMENNDHEKMYREGRLWTGLRGQRTRR